MSTRGWFHFEISKGQVEVSPVVYTTAAAAAISGTVC